jgi:hypothetical protein
MLSMTLFLGIYSWFYNRKGASLQDLKLYLRPLAVTRMCADYDSYLKIGPNQKKRGSKCWARQALFALKATTIFETSIFETPPCWKRTNFDDCNIASKHKSKHTHTNPKRRNDEPCPTSMLLRLHYLQSANQMLVLFWAPSKKLLLLF